MRRLTGFVELIPRGLRATFFYAVAMAWTKGLSMVTIPVLTSMLTPAQFGRLELLSSAAEIGGLIAGAGLVDTLFRFASAPGAAGRRAGAEVTGLSLFIAWRWRLGSRSSFPGDRRRRCRWRHRRCDIVLLGIAVALESTIGVPLGWLRMHQRAGAFAALVDGAGRAAGRAAWWCWSLTGHGVDRRAVGRLRDASDRRLGADWSGRSADTGIVFAPRASLRLLAYGLPLIGSGLAAFVLGTADRWLLAGTVSAASLGQYGLAAKIAMITALLAQPFEMWWYPQRLGLVSTPEGLARSSRVVSAGAAGLLCAGAATALASPWLITLLAPPSYAPAQMMVPFLVLALVLQLLSSMANAGCYAREHEQPDHGDHRGRGGDHAGALSAADPADGRVRRDRRDGGGAGGAVGDVRDRLPADGAVAMAAGPAVGGRGYRCSDRCGSSGPGDRCDRRRRGRGGACGDDCVGSADHSRARGVRGPAAASDRWEGGAAAVLRGGVINHEAAGRTVEGKTYLLGCSATCTS